ncbi:MAG: sulfite exporter TauE/SafE family protein [Actinomycetota bacterium]|nr:sulfite exporter TauE/SafE family protein [Actinomycetota bacterium]
MSTAPPNRTPPVGDPAASTVVIGLIAGLTSGLFGVGGGVVMVPVLVALHRFDQHAAHATSLAAIVPIAAAGAAVFALSSEVDVGSAIWLSLGSILGAQLGARLMARAGGIFLRGAYGFLLLTTATVMVVR